MIVVADASPLNYLVQIQCDGLLPQLYERVFVPEAVIEELRHPRAPSAMVSWLRQTPRWLEVRRAVVPEKSLETLDAGEREAIFLAETLHAHLLLIDEKRGRAEAKRRAISTIGTLGVLLAGAEKNLVNPETAFQKLVTETSFRATSELRDLFLRYCKEITR